MEDKPLTVEEIDALLLESMKKEEDQPLERHSDPSEDQVICSNCKSTNVRFLRYSDVEEHFFCNMCEREFSFIRRDILT